MARRIIVAAGVVLLAGCSAQPPPQEAPQVQMPDRAAEADLGVAGTGFGDPLPGLGAAELARFDVGKTEATVRASRRTQPLFGLGLVDATPASTFETIAFLQSFLTPSTAGTPSVVPDPSNGGQPALGKFGWKAQVPSLFVFSGDAYLNEMGITTPLFPNENCPQGTCDLLQYNPALETPNDDGTGVVRFNDFMTFLGPPPRGSRNLVTAIGNAVAAAIGCLDCHAQTLRTGPNA